MAEVRGQRDRRSLLAQLGGPHINGKTSKWFSEKKHIIFPACICFPNAKIYPGIESSGHVSFPK